jgi:hypothetical protein
MIQKFKDNYVVILIIIALAICVLRFMMPKHTFSLAGTYMALAHFFVGGCFFAWLLSEGARRKFFMCMFWGLSAVEVFAVLAR